jgi:hypothetical protein
MEMSGKHSGRRHRSLDQKALQQMDKAKENLNVAATEYEQLAESYLLGVTSEKVRRDAYKNTQQTYARLAKLHREYLEKPAYNSSEL